jgi:hypothetical protein
MTIPHLDAPDLLILAEATQVLLPSSQDLLNQGELEAEFPERIREAHTAALARLQELNLAWPDPLRSDLRVLLQLTHPQALIALLQDLLDQGEGPDLERFLQSARGQLYPVRLPRLVVCSEVMQQLLQQDLTETDRQSLQLNLKSLQDQLDQAAVDQSVDPVRLQAQARAELITLSPQDLWQLLFHYVAEEEMQQQNADQPEGETSSAGITVSGPLLFLEIIDYLLDQHSQTLTPDQRLDLLHNRSKAEAKLRAMTKLGRMEDQETQTQWIRTWMASQSPQDLLNQVEMLFETIGSEESAP